MTRARKLATILALGLLPALANAADMLDPKAVTFQPPEQIKWNRNPSGTQTVVLAGNPGAPGLYVQMIKWAPNTGSRPHFHPNDRFITVISGTWYVGTGTTYDPEAMVPIPAGSFVVHYGKQVHYDGARDEPVLLQIVGEGPATSTPAEAR